MISTWAASDSADGLRKALPEALARANPDCVRSISRSRSNSADSVDDAHSHLPGWTGQVHPSQRKAVNSHPFRFQSFDSGPHVHGVTA